MALPAKLMTEQGSETVAALPEPAPEPGGTRRRLPGGGPDRLSVGLFSVAAFLLIFALLGSQLGGAAASHPASHAVLIRRIYRTTVVESVPPSARGGASGGASVTQSASSTSEPLPAAPVLTRVS